MVVAVDVSTHLGAGTRLGPQRGSCTGLRNLQSDNRPSLVCQGFQVLCDLSDGFSGLGSKVTEMLQDSYSGRGVLTWGLAPVSYSSSVSLKLLFRLD